MKRGDDVIFSFTGTVEQVATLKGAIHWMRCRSTNGLLIHLASEHFNFLDAEQISDDLWRIQFAGRLVYEIRNKEQLVGFHVAGKSGYSQDIRFSRLPDLVFTDLTDLVERKTA